MKIRCRAWDTHRNIMWSVDKLSRDQLSLSPDGRGFFNPDPVSTRQTKYYTNMIPLLSTGKYDASDPQVEIFDGDVVLVNKTYYRVGWNKSIGGWWFFDSGNKHYFGQLGNSIVVGNIYENPELMEEENE